MARKKLIRKGKAAVPAAPELDGMALGRLRVERMKLADITPSDRNPRVRLEPGDAAYDRIERSLDAFGYVDPLIVNRRDHTLVGGHQRYTILRAKGVVEADVAVVDLDPTQADLLRIALNKVEGAWDRPKLASLLADLQDAGVVEVGLSGYDPAEIAALRTELDAERAKDQPASDAAEPVSATDATPETLRDHCLNEARKAGTRADRLAKKKDTPALAVESLRHKAARWQAWGEWVDEQARGEK